MVGCFLLRVQLLVCSTIVALCAYQWLVNVHLGVLEALLRANFHTKCKFVSVIRFGAVFLILEDVRDAFPICIFSAHKKG